MATPRGARLGWVLLKDGVTGDFRIQGRLVSERHGPRLQGLCSEQKMPCRAGARRDWKLFLKEGTDL